MQIFEELNVNKGLSLALGFFDGVHLGHQAVVKSAVDYAEKNSAKSAVITFQDHPCCFFYDVSPKYIMRRTDKIKAFEALNVDYLYFIKFDEFLASMNAQEYLQDILVKNFAPISISTGFNYYFGAKKSGDVNLLKQSQAEFRYEYFEISPVLYKDEVISSTAIRKYLAQGDIPLVNAMLGEKYFLEETVKKGKQLGRTIGFKTANLIYPKNLLEVGSGVYSVEVEIFEKTYKGIANYGLRPTIENAQESVLEVHILNFDEDIYGEKIKVKFLQKLRNEKKFSSLEDLKLQIKKDIDSID